MSKNQPHTLNFSICLKSGGHIGICYVTFCKFVMFEIFHIYKTQTKWKLKQNLHSLTALYNFKLFSLYFSYRFLNIMYKYLILNLYLFHAPTWNFFFFLFCLSESHPLFLWDSFKFLFLQKIMPNIFIYQLITFFSRQL